MNPITVDLEEAKTPLEVTQHTKVVTPGIPQEEPFAGIYTLFYLERTTHLVTKNFRMKGEMREIIARTKNYCELMRYRFLYVRPFISDLADDLAKNKALMKAIFRPP